jgi:putative transposase
VGVSIIKIGYPKYIARENGDFNNVHVWTYGYLLRRIYEVAEEYGIAVIYVNEAYTLSKCRFTARSVVVELNVDYSNAPG